MGMVLVALTNLLTDCCLQHLIIPCHFKKCGVLCCPATLKSVGYYVIPPIQKLHLSVRLAVRLYIRRSAHRFHSRLGAYFNQFSSNLLCELLLGRSVLGLQIGKFWQISTELQPLIHVRNWFSLSIFGIPSPVFFKLGMRVNIVKECSGIADW